MPCGQEGAAIVVVGCLLTARRFLLGGGEYLSGVYYSEILTFSARETITHCCLRHPQFMIGVGDN